MKIQMEMTGLTELRAKLDAMSKRATNMHDGLHAAGEIALQSARDRIAAGGPGWTPNLNGNPLLNRSGALLASLNYGGNGNIERYDGEAIEVGTNLPYARYMQEGTGIYGPTGQRIQAKGKAMAFSLGGKTVFAKSIAGSPKRAFLLLDEETDAKIAAKLHEYITVGSG